MQITIGRAFELELTSAYVFAKLGRREAFWSWRWGHANVSRSRS